MNASAAIAAEPVGSGTVLVVDDEADIRRMVSLALSRIGVETHTAANLAEARELLNTYSFDACLTDMRLPDGNGVDFVAEVVAAWPELPIAVITAHGQMSAAVEAMKNGAFDFVSKPMDLAMLRGLVQQALEMRNAPAPERGTNSRAPSNCAAVNGLVHGERLVGNSHVMQELRKRIIKVARSNAPVWITGESGTGKELIATLVHANGPRYAGPFVAINCGAIPSELVESELFGHVKGSFTGAHQDKEGLFQAANGGTLFLDEIAALPLHMQVKLLRAIQERSVRPVGAHAERAVDVRMLSASHENLGALVETGLFRQDLYYRLNVIQIQAPSLRDRPSDIPELCRHIVVDLQQQTCRGEASKYAAETTPLISSEALLKLSTYAFPGNVRELQNILERAHALGEGQTIRDCDIETPSDAIDPGHDGHSRELPSRRLAEIDDERARICDALEKTHWNRKRAAEQLGLSYRQLRYRIARLDLE